MCQLKWQDRLFRQVDLYMTWAYVVENSSPALHGNTLEHREHRKEDVVKLSDAVVRPDPRAVTVVFLRTPTHAAGKLHFRGVHRLVIW